MGQEIENSRFSQEDFAAFAEQLAQETALLERWFAKAVFPECDAVGGFELEAWLVDDQARPAPVNTELLKKLGDPLVVPELSRFNIELNGPPRRLQGDGLSRMADDLSATWAKCGRVAADLDSSTRLAMIGILPTVLEKDLSPENMSSMKRYQALDEQLSRLRNGAPLKMDITGRDHLHFKHDDVMLESATTSFQIHLKIDPARSGRFYNAAKIISAPMVALAANSPYLFGADLWDETRIPLFEQAVSVGDTDATKRVSFGIRYVRDTVMECFRANLQRYPVLLPRLMDEPIAQLSHLRLHNGTVWRWNRPLVGFNEAGEPHLRLEHRVVPAGPTVKDSIANSAFFFGTVCAMSEMADPPEQQLAFAQAKENFYLAARNGLRADIIWLDGRKLDVRALCQMLLPVAKQGLSRMGIAPEEIDYWLGIINRRLANGQNGASWQRAWVARYGRDMRGLTESYLERQESGRPVHEWGV